MSKKKVVRLSEGQLCRLIENYMSDIQYNAWKYAGKDKNEEIKKINDYFDKLSDCDYENDFVRQFRYAVGGSEKAKQWLVYNLGVILDIDRRLIAQAFNERYRGKSSLSEKVSLDRIIKESIEKVLNESFSSGKLKSLANQHGGIKVTRNGGYREGNSAWVRGRDKVPVSQITDDMLVGEPYIYNDVDPKDWDKMENVVRFNDGYAIGLRDDIQIKNPRTGWEKYGSGIGDTGDHDRDENWGGSKRAESAPYHGMTKKARSARDYRKAIEFNKTNQDLGDRDADARVRNIKARARRDNLLRQ